MVDSWYTQDKLSKDKLSKDKKIYIGEVAEATHTDVRPYKEIISYLNEKTGKKFSSSSKANQSHINARIKEGYTVDDFKKVIDTKTKEWLNNTDMNKFLRPETLFGTKFESYLNESTISENKGKDDVDRILKALEDFEEE